MDPEGNPVKYGLFNQGATCYLNSVLQVLYMTPDFRAAVKRHTSENPDTKCIDHHLQPLFDDLKRKTAKTDGIREKLGIENVCEQRDAAEYFEKILALTSDTASEIFHGQLTHKTVCSKRHGETLTSGAFWHLPLTLVESDTKRYSVVEGIKDFFSTSAFTGENQMYCEECDAKTDANIECEMKHHPEVLVLLLKRFEFSYLDMSYVKMNCNVAIPRTLQIPKNQMYELYAVVNHSGDLRNGHYTVTIKDEMGTYNFNDSRVNKLDEEPLQEDDFLSVEAYLLFYRKQKDCKEEFTSPGITPDISDSVEMREAEGAEGGAGVEAVTLTNSQEETRTEDKEIDQERKEMMKKDEERKTGADERVMESETRTPAIQVDVKVNYQEQKTFGDDQRFNQGSNKSHEEQEELGSDVIHSAGQEKKTENYMKRRSQREPQLKTSPKNNEDTVEAHEPKRSGSLDGIMNKDESQRDTKCMKTETSQGCTEKSVQCQDCKGESEPKAKNNLKLEKSEKTGRKMEKKKEKKGKRNINQEKKNKRSCILFCGTRGMTSDSD